MRYLSCGAFNHYSWYFRMEVVMRKKGRRCIGICLTLALILTSVPNAEVSMARKASATAKKAKKISMRVGQKKKLKIKTKKKIKWKSSKKKVVSVSKKGVIKAKKKGTAVVKAKYGKKVKRFKVTVRPKKKKKITPKPTIKPTIKPTPKRTPGKTPQAPAGVPSVTPTGAPAVTPTGAPSVPPTDTLQPSASPSPQPTTEVVDLTDKSMKELYQSSFMVGAAINGSQASTAAIRHEGMANILKKHYNSTTLSNLMKPNYLLDESACQKAAERDGENTAEVGVKFDSCKESLDFCRDNGIQMRGHVLVWHDQTPEWFFKKGYQTKNDYVSKEVMEKRMENYIKNVLQYCQTNYPGVIYCWDVVNECVDSVSPDTTEGWKCRTTFNGKRTHWYQVMGVDYVYKAFEYARKYASPDVKLIYNDFNVFQVDKRNSICKLLQILKERGLVDGVGLQPTVLLKYPSQLKGTTSADSFENCLRAYGELGLDIQVTELSFEIQKTEKRSEENLKLQADRYQEMFELLLEMDDDNGGPCHITSVTVFGICDDYPLYTNHEQCLYLWNKDCTAKEAYYRVHEVGEKYFAGKNNLVTGNGE